MPERITNPDLFLSCLTEAAGNQELVSEFDRLTGYNISGKGPGIVQEIDRVTGYLDMGARAFYEFVFECIYLRVEASLNEG